MRSADDGDRFRSSERFDRLSATWWNAAGLMRPLHVVNGALRLAASCSSSIASHFGRDGRVAGGTCGCSTWAAAAGCSRSRWRGAAGRVVGIDASRGNVAAAQRHAASQGVAVEYRLGEPARGAAARGVCSTWCWRSRWSSTSQTWAAFVGTVAQHVAPGGLLLASTIDRTWKSFVFAIVGAEYVLARSCPGARTSGERFRAAGRNWRPRPRAQGLQPGSTCGACATCQLGAPGLAVPGARGSTTWATLVRGAGGAGPR
ncbi:MAG: hypothetical protein MZV65_32885 [Chromatiales bacterium]|nr:hypothetical protein [Chromatiales bacterium]